MTTTEPSRGRWRHLETALGRVRARTFGLIDPLGHDDLHKQYSKILSPVVWDIGHVGNFEELWLLREVDGRPAHNETLDEIYDAFDNPRWTRSELPLLDRAEAVEYMTEVRNDALAVMRRKAAAPDTAILAGGYVYDMVVQHEAQHQETVLQALDMRQDMSPYTPARSRALPLGRRVDDTDRVIIAAGGFLLGTNDRDSAYDNERPAHPVEVDAFAIDRYPTSARRYAEFVEVGGYQEDTHWSEEGLEWLAQTGHEAPQGWISDLDGGWLVRRFGTVEPLNPAEPVQHVSFFEAQAFAQWAGGRLPTEPEWEKAALWDPGTGLSRTYPWGSEMPDGRLANVDHAGWGPAPVGSYPAGSSPSGVEQMIGDVHEWTSSGFEAYPGYSTFPYPEYSEVFFNGDYRVLRGSSWASSRHVARGTFRNWDHPKRRQIFSGIRLTWDLA